MDNYNKTYPSNYNKTYLTKAQVAAKFQVDPRTVYSWMKNGLPHFRLGATLVRFDPNDLEEWYEQYVVVQHQQVANKG